MDEPFTGLDPVNVQLLKEAFLEMRDRGKTLIFSTHQMETVEELCESIAIVDRGRVVVSGTLRDVRRPCVAAIHPPRTFMRSATGWWSTTVVTDPSDRSSRFKSASPRHAGLFAGAFFKSSAR